MKFSVALLLRGLGLCSGFASSVLLSKALGVQSYGQFTLAMTASTLVAQLGDGGLQTLIARDLAVSPNPWARAASGLLLRFISTSLLAVGIYVLLVNVSHFQSPYTAIVLTAPFATASLFQVATTNRFRPEISALIAFVPAFLSLAVAAAVRGLGLADHLTLLTWISSLVVAAASFLLAKKYWHWRRPSVSELKIVLAETWPLAVASVFTTVYYRIDAFVIAAVGDAMQLAPYYVAYRFLDLFQIVPQVLLSTLMPRFSQGNVRQEFVASTHLMAAVGLLSSVGIYFAGNTLVPLAYGKGFEAVSDYLPILSLCCLPISFGYLFGPTLTFLGQQRYFMRLSVVGAIVGVGLCFIAVRAMGAIGAALSTLTVECLIASLQFRRVRAVISAAPTGNNGILLFVGVWVAVCLGQIVFAYDYSLVLCAGCIIMIVALLSERRRILSGLRMVLR